MKAFCDLSIKFDDEEMVNTVLKSIEVDNFDFVKSFVKDKVLEAHIESNSVSSLLHTIDDYLSCVSVAEKIVDKD
jgi:hypothetical protein